MGKKMKIVMDDKIPYILDTLKNIADEIVCMPGKEMTAADVHDADAIIIRTRTRCDKRLLQGSKVRFVATATIGFDHLDTEFLGKAGIRWMNCPGCNSGSVAQYIRSTLILLHREKGMTPNGHTVGIVGCGHVGSKVKVVAEEMGYRVLVCDPPLQESGAPGRFVDMETIARQCDIITFHVPLTSTGKYATHHLAGTSFLGSLAKRPAIINSSRGGVVDNDALLLAMKEGKVAEAVIDTWENEPDINLELMHRAFIATPHIAGYSADGKVNADNMVIAGLCNFFGITNKYHIDPPASPLKTEWRKDEKVDDDEYLKCYNPLSDSEKLKSNPLKFEELRGNYPLRRELTIK